MASKELLKGTTQTVILKVLSDFGKMYGYEITQKVKELTKGEILLSEGSLYPHLHRMEAEGILSIETVHIGKRIRKYYRITEVGKSVVEEKVEEFSAFVRTMQNVLKLDPSL
jgi:DNA-binding PadR family transcriptional regulator